MRTDKISSGLGSKKVTPQQNANVSQIDQHPAVLNKNRKVCNKTL